MENWHGFDKLVDFSHQHTPASNIVRTFAVLMALLLYHIAFAGVSLAAGMSRNDLATLLHPLTLTANLMGPPVNVAEITTGSVWQLISQRMLFFRACVVAPLWEEVVFRMLPIVFAVLVVMMVLYLKQIITILWHMLATLKGTAEPATNSTEFPLLANIPLRPPNFIVIACAASSIIFGLGHGGPMNIFLQGITGGAFCWLYYKNNYSYLSVVTAHAIWNFLVIFGIRILVLWS